MLKVLGWGCTVTIAVTVVAFAIAWLTVFKQPPPVLPDVFYWTTSAHVYALLLFCRVPYAPATVAGSWLCCVTGMIFATGAVL